jgi:hypothetical protein
MEQWHFEYSIIIYMRMGTIFAKNNKINCKNKQGLAIISNEKNCFFFIVS